MTFDPAFRFYRDDPQQRRQLPYDEVFREVDDELQRRRQSYPDLVAKGRMNRADADHELRVWSRIRDGERGDRPTTVTGAAASWVEIIHALRREIAIRRQRYPRLVATGRLDAVVATRRLELIECLHDGHWLPWDELTDAARAQLEEPRPAWGIVGDVAAAA